MIFYLGFAPFYRLPKGIGEETLGYGYDLDERKFCEELAMKNPCSDSENQVECSRVFENLSLCVQTMDLWLHSLNEKCFTEINTLELCADEQKNCRNEYFKLQACESNLERPEWLKNEQLKRWDRFTRANTLQKKTKEDST